MNAWGGGGGEIISTYYAVSIEDPYYTSSTFPGFTIDNVVDIMEDEEMLENGYVPMNSSEYSLFKKTIERTKGHGSERYYVAYDLIKDKLDYTKYIEGDNSVTQTTYSFWYTGAYDSGRTVLAYGADTAGDYDVNLSRVAKSIGERNFYEYAVVRGRRFKTYSQLESALKNYGVTSPIVSEEELVQACKEETYYTCRV